MALVPSRLRSVGVFSAAARFERLAPPFLAGLVIVLPAAAQFAKPEDAIKYRKNVMFLQTTYLGRLGAMRASICTR